MNDADRRQAETVWQYLREEMEAIVRDCRLLENIDSNPPQNPPQINTKAA